LANPDSKQLVALFGVGERLYSLRSVAKPAQRLFIDLQALGPGKRPEWLRLNDLRADVLSDLFICIVGAIEILQQLRRLLRRWQNAAIVSSLGIFD
jgi:hypothetical protein